MEDKRVIEVFTTGCTRCQPIVDIVKSMANSSWEVIIYDLRQTCDTKECLQKIQQYRLQSLPAVAVNGVLLDCYKSQRVVKPELLKADKAAGAIV